MFSVDIMQREQSSSFKGQICSKDAFNFLFFVEAMNPPSNLFSSGLNNDLSNQVDNFTDTSRHKIDGAKNYNCKTDSTDQNLNLFGDMGFAFDNTPVDGRPFKTISFNPVLQRIVNNDTTNRKILSQKDGDVHHRQNHHHNRHHHHTTDRNFVCRVCGKSFKRKSSLSTHKLIHENVKPFACLTCNKTFLRRSDLKKHVLMHTGQKPHQCSECGRVFSQSSNMLTHMRRHSGVRPFSCQICGNSFFRKVDVRRHQVKHLKDE